MKPDMIKPRTPPGVLELLPKEQIAFQRFLDTIRAGYERFGFLPVETPVFELVDVLLTKEGGDTEKQVYFVQSTGAREQNKPPELALRFDLTVPLARYVAEHEHELAFPFRRYQIQRVYRGERAQKGRFREFYQCDIDVIGKDTLPLAYDAEMPAVIHHVFHELDVGAFTIQLNNRKLLRGMLASQGVGPEKQAAVLREVDKLDKLPTDVVRGLLSAPETGLSDVAAGRLLEVLGAKGTNEEILARADALASTSPELAQGLAELRGVLDGMAKLGVHMKHVKVELSIARGLDYYTGTVYETRLVDHPGIGSVCSGGRYDDLAGHYTKSRLPGVGISIGATRLFDKLREAGLVRTAASTVHAYVTQLDPALSADCLALAAELRKAGVNTELAPEPGKAGKQLKYADRAGVRFVLLYGGEEKNKGVVAVKELSTGNQTELPRAQVAAHLAELVRR